MKVLDQLLSIPLKIMNFFLVIKSTTPGNLAHMTQKFDFCGHKCRAKNERFRPNEYSSFNIRKFKFPNIRCTGVTSG